ncbi:MAG: hypothetical protein ABIR68_06805, partial [Ilumatobacteraceae bacterium]
WARCEPDVAHTAPTVGERTQCGYLALGLPPPAPLMEEAAMAELGIESTSAGWRARVNAYLSGHHGVISADVAISLGAPRRTLYNDVERGRLAIIAGGVLRSTQWPLGREQLMAAACARSASVAVGFTTAAKVWNLRRIPNEPDVHVLVPHGCSPEVAGVVVHRCRRIDPVDITEREDGVRLTSPPRTLFDCADILGFDAAASVLEQVIDMGRGTFETHVDTWVRLARPRRPGSRTMARVLGSRPAWRHALQSDLEARVSAEIGRQQLPVPEAQWKVQLSDGRNIRLDFAWPEVRVALEVDHPFWHAGAEESHLDRSRDRHLMAMGWVVPRVTSVDVGADLAASIAQVATIIAERSTGRS